FFENPLYLTRKSTRRNSHPRTTANGATIATRRSARATLAQPYLPRPRVLAGPPETISLIDDYSAGGSTTIPTPAAVRTNLGRIGLISRPRNAASASPT